MTRIQLFAVVLFASAAAHVSAAPQGGGTLNYRNVTSAQVHPTVGETTNNEKEVEFGDFDNDGDLDVVIAVAYSDFGTRRNKLYRNDDGHFNEVSGNTIIPGFSILDVTR
ncbi:MAG: VCBS repeat-containing protein, partial [Phycisphaerales bacterium]